MAMKNTSIRIDEELLLKLRMIAEKEYRSVNSQIFILIRDFIAQYEKKFGPIELQP